MDRVGVERFCGRDACQPYAVNAYESISHTYSNLPLLAMHFERRTTRVWTRCFWARCPLASRGRTLRSCPSNRRRPTR